MKILSLLVTSILLSCLSLFAQYDSGTEIFIESSNFGSNIIQKLYKVDDFNGDGYIDIIMIKPQYLFK